MGILFSIFILFSFNINCFRFALAQIEVIPGQPDKNVNQMLSFINQAKAENVDIIAFPEMCIGGYLLSDKWLEESYCRNLMQYNKSIIEASEDIVIIFGNIFVDDQINERCKTGAIHPNKDGRVRKYNAAYVVQNGSLVSISAYPVLPHGIQPKTLFPNYRFFDDERYFFSAQDIAMDFNLKLNDILKPFEVKIKNQTVKIGVELCEDLWCQDYRHNLQPLNPTKILIENGADVIINISASPWTIGKNSSRDRKIRFLKSECKKFVPFLYVNSTGTQNNGKNFITFDGGSTVYNSEGYPIMLSQRPYEPELMIIDNFDGKLKKRTEKAEIEEKYLSIIQVISHLKNIFEIPENPNFVVGLSGGIDSAVVLALLVKAVGPNKVTAINMPTIYNSKKTQNIAESIAKKLGVKYLVIPIQELSSLNRNILTKFDEEEKRNACSLNDENIMAKIRGTSILSNYAQRHNAILTNNGNKLETALGYATLYGDVNGAIAPIGDLTKVEVFELARFLNEKVFNSEVIPASLIPDANFQFSADQMPPSAELKENQFDPMKFGYHDALLEKLTDYKKYSPEDFVQWFIESNLAEKLGIKNELLEIYNLKNPKIFIEDLEWFMRKIQINTFKRIQAPPIIITSKSAYGFDIRESQLPNLQTKKYQELKAKLFS